jgi:hypothetical protein
VLLKGFPGWARGQRSDAVGHEDALLWANVRGALLAGDIRALWGWGGCKEFARLILSWRKREVSSEYKRIRSNDAQHMPSYGR